MLRRRKKAAASVVVEPKTFSVKLVRLGLPPYLEVGAYKYTAEALPAEGDMITLTSILNPWGPRPHEIRARVTRVDPIAAMPISATEVERD